MRDKAFAVNSNSAGKYRNSGIEALKIFAILLIIISHIVQTLQARNHQYYIDFSIASGNIQNMVLVFMRSFGALGNLIFFVCSAWFLVDSRSYSKRKWLAMLIEIWVVSVAILVLMLLFAKRDIAVIDIIKSLLPTTFSNNWYLTCYLLFYPIHPFLNEILNCCKKKQLLRIAIVMFFLYYLVNFVHVEHYQANHLIHWIATYFIKHWKNGINSL